MIEDPHYFYTDHQEGYIPRWWVVIPADELRVAWWRSPPLIYSVQACLFEFT